MLISADSERTSNPTPNPKAQFVSACWPDYVGKAVLPSVIVSRRSFGGEAVYDFLDPASSPRVSYEAQVQVNSPTGMSFMNATLGKVADIIGAYTVNGTTEPFQLRLMGIPRLTQGADAAAITAVETWTPIRAAALSVEMNEALDQLRGIVQSTRLRSPLQLSATVERLIDRAASRSGAPQDIAGWARTIADDVADLTD